MKPEIEILKAEISAEYLALDELRRFRHVFRSGYRLHFDADRLAGVRREADRLRLIYLGDLDAFLRFLDSLAAG